jgi:mannose-6-phosphate isomerase-like protein (cupin superfamily)
LRARRDSSVSSSFFTRPVAGYNDFMTSQTDTDRRLDFGRAGMWWQITRTTADTAGEYFEALNVINPNFDGPPLHVHPHAEESYAVTQGVLDVCVAGTWLKLGAGESVTVPPGTPHTLRNTSGGEVRLVNVHRPAMEFERFFRRLHALCAAGQVTLPPRGLGATIRLSMLFTAHKNEIVSIKPPAAAMRLLARIGRLLGYRLPP